MKKLKVMMVVLIMFIGVIIISCSSNKGEKSYQHKQEVKIENIVSQKPSTLDSLDRHLDSLRNLEDFLYDDIVLLLNSRFDKNNNRVDNPLLEKKIKEKHLELDELKGQISVTLRKWNTEEILSRRGQ